MYPQMFACKFFEGGEEEQEVLEVDDRNLLFFELWFEFWMLCKELWRVFCKEIVFCKEFGEFCNGLRREFCVEVCIELCRFMFWIEFCNVFWRELKLKVFGDFSAILERPMVKKKIVFRV